MPKLIHGDVKQKILNAAQERLWHYGFKKTTIDEIATDAGVGKGTVYLYFDSKEDIALTIMAAYKEETIELQEAIVRDASLAPIEKLRQILLLPIMRSHEAIVQHPAAVEMVCVIRPHIQARLRPYLEQEVALIGQALEEGNREGVFDIEDTMTAARSLKYMTSGFWPPYPCISEPEQRREEVGKIVDLVVRGLRKCG
jgi:AcrR family transcriptional regulator